MKAGKNREHERCPQEEQLLARFGGPVSDHRISHATEGL
jgi:hypothetical protein